MRSISCAGILLALTATIGCIDSMREPGTIPTLPGGSGVTEPGTAQSWFEEGTLESVRLAEQAWLADVSETRHVPSLIGLTRARIWLATHEKNQEARREAAGSAVESGQWCALASPDDVRCNYWLALALGVQAQQRRSTALDALPRIVELLESVVDRAPDLDHAGAHRVLALVYLRAPGWPAGPGDPDAALVQARLAIDRASDYPPNRLCLAEALAATGEIAEAAESYRIGLHLAEEWEESGHREATEWAVEAESALVALDVD